MNNLRLYFAVDISIILIKCHQCLALNAQQFDGQHSSLIDMLFFV